MSIQKIGSSPDYKAGLPAVSVAASEQPQKRQAPAAEAKPAETTEASAEQIQSAINKIQQSVPLAQQNMQFSVDDETGKTVVSITDKDSGELIRQVPSEELMEIAKNIGRMQGLLVNNQA
jgi:flagellar protein FlaG